MYEALVARVRYHIQKANFMGLKEAESTLLLGEAADAIEELQADVRPVARGKWIWTVADDEYLGEYWKCNLCGEHSYIGYNYCPDCGAKMDAPDMDFGERDGDGE